MNRTLALRFLIWLVFSLAAIDLISSYVEIRSHQEGLCSPGISNTQQNSSQTH
jgi:hypothetical protein